MRWRGRLISQDLANSALESSAIARALAGDKPRSIVEIGAGYGRLGHALLSVFPSVSYTVVDIEPALSVSNWYLSRLFPTRHLRFLTPGKTDEIATVTPDQIAGYLELLDVAGRTPADLLPKTTPDGGGGLARRCGGVARQPR